MEISICRVDVRSKGVNTNKALRTVPDPEFTGPTSHNNGVIIWGLL